MRAPPARARVADDGTFATTIILNKNTGAGELDIYVGGPAPGVAAGYAHLQVMYHRQHGPTKAGYLASKLLGAGGYGLVGDIIVGVIGAVLGGFLFGLLTGRSDGVNNLDIGSSVVAIVGVCLLIAILRAVSGNRARV